MSMRILTRSLQGCMIFKPLTILVDENHARSGCLLGWQPRFPSQRQLHKLSLAMHSERQSIFVIISLD